MTASLTCRNNGECHESQQIQPESVVERLERQLDSLFRRVGRRRFSQAHYQQPDDDHARQDGQQEERSQFARVGAKTSAEL